MKIRTLLAFLVLSASAFAQLGINAGTLGGGAAPVTPPTWVYVQDALGGCNAGTCTVSAAIPTTAGSVLVVGVWANNFAATALTSISGAGGTWLGGGSGNQILEVDNAFDLAYDITGTGGSQSISVSATGSPNYAFLLEIKCTANCGTISLDQGGVTSGNSSCGISPTCPGAAYTSLSGSADLEIQFVYPDSGIASVTGGYAIAHNDGWFIYNLASSVLTAPALTLDSGGQQFVASALAFQ
jgi:hypothetical protein